MTALLARPEYKRSFALHAALPRLVSKRNGVAETRLERRSLQVDKDRGSYRLEDNIGEDTVTFDIDEHVQSKLWTSLLANPRALLSGIRQGVDESFRGYRDYTVPQPRTLAALCDKIARLLARRDWSAGSLHMMSRFGSPAVLVIHLLKSLR